jgi:PAS fold
LIQRPALRLVEGGLDSAATWLWFCGHCAAPSPGGAAPPPTARVCNSCGLGLLLEAREDVVPSNRDAFLVVDSSLLVQAMSREAQSLLGMTEEMAIDKPVAELLVPADAEAQGRAGFAQSIVTAADGRDPDTARCFVRPWNTFGVRMRARIATCGPPRAALIVLDNGRPPALRAVPHRRR